jgi:hypothetical protein
VNREKSALERAWKVTLRAVHDHKARVEFQLPRIENHQVSHSRLRGVYSQNIRPWVSSWKRIGGNILFSFVKFPYQFR